MVYFQYGDHEYKISWRYYDSFENHHHYQMKSTVCSLFDLTTGEIWNNLASCSAKDNFCKETGRKISLTRVLEKFNDKGFRKAAWQSYHSRKQNDDNK